MYPKLQIKTDGILENALNAKKLCESRGVKLSLVTKCLVSDENVVKILTENGIDSICESRIQNFIDYKDIKAEKWLIREPMLSEISDVVKYADVSLNSEIKTLEALDKEAEKQGKNHKVLLMYELGDLREGANEEELCALTEYTLSLKNITLYGIGVNLSCYGSIMPDENNMRELSEVCERIEKKFNIKLDVISGGNSTSFPILKEGKLPENINSLRFGEAVFLGNVPCIEQPIGEFNRDNFVLQAQIVEIKDKPSVPRGVQGVANSFGEEPMVFEDLGIRKRALVSIGKQDFNIGGLSPRDKKIKVLEGSSDYVILDVTDSDDNFEVGDIVEFDINYSVLLGAMNSRYVYKEYVK